MIADWLQSPSVVTGGCSQKGMICFNSRLLWLILEFQVDLSLKLKMYVGKSRAAASQQGHVHHGLFLSK